MIRLAFEWFLKMAAFTEFIFNIFITIMIVRLDRKKNNSAFPEFKSKPLYLVPSR